MGSVDSAQTPRDKGPTKHPPQPTSATTPPRVHVLCVGMSRASLSSVERLAAPAKLTIHCAPDGATALETLQTLHAEAWLAVITSLSVEEGGGPLQALLQTLAQIFPRAYPIVWTPAVTCSVSARLLCFGWGAKMLANDTESIELVLPLLTAQFRRPKEAEGGPTYVCPSCQLGGLSQHALVRHYPLYHESQPNCPATCPVCEKRCPNRFPVHLHNVHGPEEDREPPAPAFAAFSWVVCQRPDDGMIVLVHEPAAIAGGAPNYWFPAGRVDGGETLIEAAIREAEEEAGLAVSITGVYRFQLSRGLTFRVMLQGTPRDEGKQNKNLTGGGGGGYPVPKSIPDFESCGAVWGHASDFCELGRSSFRASDTPHICQAVASGAMKASSIDTPSFRELDSLVARFTGEQVSSESRSVWKAAVAEVWSMLKAEYPPELFFES